MQRLGDGVRAVVARQHARALESARRRLATSVDAAGEESLRVISGTPTEHATRTLKIYRPARVATQQGRGSKTKAWKAEFHKYEGKDRWTNPLMGWTSTGDPLTNTGLASLAFPSKEAAIAYATRNGFDYVVSEPEESRENIRSFNAYGKSMVHQWRHKPPVYRKDEEE